MISRVDAENNTLVLQSDKLQFVDEWREGAQESLLQPGGYRTLVLGTFGLREYLRLHGNALWRHRHWGARQFGTYFSAKHLLTAEGFLTCSYLPCNLEAERHQQTPFSAASFHLGIKRYMGEQ
jgi:hypothetical protein